jgi:hypothetical protein
MAFPVMARGLQTQIGDFGAESPGITVFAVQRQGMNKAVRLSRIA